MSFLESTLAFVTFTAAALGIVSSIFWMITGWRAMRAHERLADSVEHRPASAATELPR